MTSRAAVSWKNGHLLNFNHIPTAKPLLMLENRWGIFRGRSYVLTEHIEGVHAFEYFETCQESPLRESMAKQINKLVHAMHSCGFIHGDLKAHNIWIHDERPLLIDLDGMAKTSNQQMKADDWRRLKRDLGKRDITTAIFEAAHA